MKGGFLIFNPQFFFIFNPQFLFILKMLANRFSIYKNTNKTQKFKKKYFWQKFLKCWEIAYNTKKTQNEKELFYINVRNNSITCDENMRWDFEFFLIEVMVKANRRFTSTSWGNYYKYMIICWKGKTLLEQYVCKNTAIPSYPIFRIIVWKWCVWSCFLRKNGRRWPSLAIFPQSNYPSSGDHLIRVLSSGDTFLWCFFAI